MKKIAMIAALLCISGSALAEVGLGVSIQSNDSTIYMPINVSKGFRIEPMLQYRKSSNEERLYPSSLYTLTASADTTAYMLGVGLFGVTQLGESANVYYGGRLGYVKAEFEVSYPGTLPPGYGRPMSSSEDIDGFMVAPTIGLEYRFSEHFSIGGEAALTYSSTDGDETSNESTSTTTNIIFRYMF
jgi:hypothetical protein